jgi:hypothetical protein
VPEFLVQARFSSHSWVGSPSRSPAESARADDLIGLFQRIGAKVHGIWFSVGEYDLIVIADVPEHIDAATMSISLRVMGGGTFDKVFVTPLLNERDIADACVRATTGIITSDPTLPREPLQDLPIDERDHNAAVTGAISEQPQAPHSHPASEHPTSALIPDPEPGLVRGRPNVYGIHYPNVNGWYIGKNETGVAEYMGSPSSSVLQAIADTHEEVGLPIVARKRILWSPPSATRDECRDQEWVWIGRFRAEHEGPVFNVFPIQDWSNHLSWYHDPVTHVDRTTNCRWGVYLKLQQHCDSDGNCSLCRQPWTRDERRIFWSKVVLNDGTEQMLYGPGPHSGKTYASFRDHKFEMLHGDPGETEGPPFGLSDEPEPT